MNSIEDFKRKLKNAIKIFLKLEFDLYMMSRQQRNGE